MKMTSSQEVFEYKRSFEIIQDGFLTPYRTSSVPGNLYGCAYRADGSKVASSERSGGHVGDMLVADNPDWLPRPASARRLPGRSLYLGNYIAHFGHFVFETLSTFWIFEEFDPAEFDHFVFHPFVFGTGIPEHARVCFERMGVDLGKIVFVEDEPLAFDELLVPERLARINKSADPALRWVFDRILGDALAQDPQRRIYISRRIFNRGQHRRVVANELRVEALFAKAGFEIVYPERMSFAEQIATCGGAAVLAGLGGSNLFNVLFTPRNTLLIELADPRYIGACNPSQPPCNVIAGARGRLIDFRGLIFGPRKTILIDVGYLAERLDEMLRAEIPELRSMPKLTPRRASPAEMLEIGWRCVRPTLGHLVTSMRSRLAPSGRSASRPAVAAAAPIVEEAATVHAVSEAERAA